MSESGTAVVIADDSELYRHILVRLLSKMPGFEVVAAAANGREAVELCAIHRPGLAVLDYDMPGMTGLQAGEQIRRVSPSTTLALLTATLDAKMQRAAVSSGFKATIAKQLGSAEVRAALQAAVGSSPDHVVAKPYGGAHRMGTRLL